MKFNTEHFEVAIGYETYHSYAEKLLIKISGDSTNPMRHFATENLAIMHRVTKSVQLIEPLQKAIQKSEPLVLLILTEGYCGDSAETFPVFAKMQEMFPDKVEVKVILRDEHLDVADYYFKTRAIPTVIGLDKQTLNEKFVWGNRPKPAQQVMDELKKKKVSIREKGKALHQWYQQDNTLTTQAEIFQLITNKARTI